MEEESDKAAEAAATVDHKEHANDVQTMGNVNGEEAGREGDAKGVGKQRCGDFRTITSLFSTYGKELGLRRPRVTSVGFRMPDELLAFLHEDPTFNLTQKGMEAAKSGFDRCTDYPTIPKHTYFEGYFHGLPAHEPVESLHPRMGSLFAKPAAPSHLRAFIVAMRDQNADFFKNLAAKLSKLGGAGKWVAKIIRNGRVAGDLAVQVHYGEGVQGHNIGWHTDGPNSLIHFGVSIRGKRSVHLVTCKSDDGKNRTVGDRPSIQNEGDMYLSSPALVRHGVEYFKCDFKSRVIAIQCRMLMIPGEYEAYMAFTRKDILAVGELIGNELALADGNFRMPTLSEVKAVYELLQKSKRRRCVVQ